MRILEEINNRYDKTAFLIGNGPNLAANIMPSWKELLKSAANRPIDFELDGLSSFLWLHLFISAHPHSVQAYESLTDRRRNEYHNP